MFGYMNPSSDSAPATPYNPMMPTKHPAASTAPSSAPYPAAATPSSYYGNADSPYCYYQQQQQNPYLGAWQGQPNGTSDDALHFHRQQQPAEPPITRPKLTTSIWEDQSTICFQVDARGICVARRQDNDMVNGTKLLNVTGISRGKRDGILKNERGRVVVKVGAMHLKGVWITFARAKALAAQFNIDKVLHPLFEDDPTSYFCQYFANNMQTTPNHLGSFYLTSQKQHQRETSDTAQAASYMSSHPQQYSTSVSEEHAAVYHPYASSSGFSSSSSIVPQTNPVYRQPQQRQQDDWIMSPPFSDHTDLQQLVIGGSSIISDSAPGTPDVTNMFPPHDASAAAMAPFSYSFASPTSSSSPLSLMPTSAECHQQEDDFYYFYHQH